MLEYLNLLSAISILETAKKTVQATENIWYSPAYDVLMHAQRYLCEQANIVMRGK